ncbi:hypothetical protein LCGC14_1946360 [marine sediment metagenome]|uniref:Uncharacterized protein n=1 Tax=marine sediment metagenome TaxID=412755 RepID=A0A0F9IFW5_9ZZZZ
MPKFTTEKLKPPIFVRMQDGHEGQVDIWLEEPNGRCHPLITINNDGTLRLPRFNTVVAKQVGLKLTGDARPVISIT